LKEYERSLYIDPSVGLTGNPLLLWDFLVNSPSVVFGAIHHSYREKVRDEFHIVLRDNLDTGQILAEQHKFYEEHIPQALDLKPVWGGIIARRHHAANCINAMEKWFVHVLRYSRRDQLSLPLVLSELEPASINLVNCDNYESKYHYWPITGYKRPEAYVVQPSRITAKKKLPWQKRISRELRRLFGKKKWNPTEFSNSVTGYDEIHSLYYVEENSPPLRVYVSDKKRLEYYRKGIASRLDWLLRDYEIPEDLITAGDFVIDIGANNGELGIWTKEKGGQYMGFEPDPAAYRALCQNVDSELLFDIALSDKNGISKFYLSTENAESSLFPPAGQSTCIELETRTLDSFLEEIETPAKIKLIKIEAEGMEPEVINGALRTLTRAEYLAVDAGQERGGENTVPEVLNLLTRKGFSIVACFLLRGTFLLRNTAD
jgi:FkbM family methyltransferase